MNWKEGKYVAGHNKSAHQRTAHGKEYQSRRNRLKHPAGRIPSPKEAFRPSTIQYMMKNKQNKHGRSNPLMSKAAQKFRSHQQHQKHGHGAVHNNPNHCFGFHSPLFSLLQAADQSGQVFYYGRVTMIKERAAAGIQCSNPSHILLAQHKIEHIKILLYSFLLCALGDADDSPLQKPAQHSAARKRHCAKPRCR